MECRKKLRNKNFSKGNLFTKGDKDMGWSISQGKFFIQLFVQWNSEREGLKMEVEIMKGCNCLTKNPVYFSFLAVFSISSKFSLYMIQIEHWRKCYKQDMNKEQKKNPKNLQNIRLKLDFERIATLTEKMMSRRKYQL